MADFRFKDWLYREPWLLGFPFRAGLFTLDLVLP